MRPARQLDCEDEILTAPSQIEGIFVSEYIINNLKGIVTLQNSEAFGSAANLTT